MVAAAAFGDVVKKSGQIEHFGAFEFAHKAAAQRELMSEFRHREAAQITHYLEYMFVDGIHVI